MSMSESWRLLCPLLAKKSGTSFVQMQLARLSVTWILAHFAAGK
jgi:hypothetical protein